MTDQNLKAKFLQILPKHKGFGGLLSQLDLDQGDTCQRTGTLIALLALKGETTLTNQAAEILGLTAEQSVALLETSPGRYVRSPNPAAGWENDPRQTSRDQLSILKVGMVANRMWKKLATIGLMQLLRCGFAQNCWSGTAYQVPDVMTPGELSTYFRALLGPWSIIPNSILDLSMFVDLLLRKSNNWDSDNMMALNMLFANLRYPTIWSRFAMKFYLKTNFMDRLWNYHKDSDGNNGCEALYWLFRSVFLVEFDYESQTTP